MNCDKIGRFPGDADTCELFPDQNSDRRFNECVGESVADIIGNITGIPMHPGFSYAAALYVQGKTPVDTGVDLLAGMDGAVAYGTLPLSEANFDALSTSSLFEANYLNYSPEDRQSARLNAQKAVQWLYSFDEVVAHIRKTNSGVLLGVKWYQSFNVPPADGELLTASGNQSLHAVAAYGLSEDGSMLRIKPWLGPKFGHFGYVYLTREMYQKCVNQAFGFDPTGIRMMYLLGIALRRYPFLLQYLPTVISNLKKKEPMNKIYEVAVANLGRHLTLDADVPGEYGCAQAVSWILLHAGYPIPTGGISTVNGLIDWMLAHGFQETHAYVTGAIITAHSPNHGNPNYAHTGVCFTYGIGSNDSDTGLFQENYNHQRWLQYFGNNGSITRYFYHK